MLDRFRWLHPRLILRELLALDDSPHAIALGAAIGMWLGLTPTVGVQMVLVIALAACTGRLLYFNRTAALLAVYVTNPLTIVPIYWFNYRVGQAILGGAEGDRGELEDALHYEGLSQWWATVVRLAREFGWPLLVGSLVVAGVVAAVTYPAVRALVRSFRGREEAEDAVPERTVVPVVSKEEAARDGAVSDTTSAA